MRALLSFLLFGFYFFASAQVNSDFAFSPGLCISENVVFQNTSTGATTYLWDFCQDGLTHATGANLVSNLSLVTPSIVSPEGIDIANDNGNWFGFVLGRDNGILYRIEFGTSLSNLSPTVTILGNIDNKFSGPTQIEVLFDNGNWYGFVTNFYSSKIVRVNFGSSLSNGSPTVTATDLGLFGTGAGPRGLDVVKRGSGYSAIVSYWDNALILLDFDNGVNSSPSLRHIISNASSFLSRPIGVALQEDNGKWYAIVANYSNGKILHLDFGANLFSDPVFSTMTTTAGSTDVALLKDGLKYYGFIETPGGLTRIDFNEGLDLDGTETVNSADNYGNALVDLFGLSFVKDGAEWRAFSLSQTNGKVHKIEFADICGGSGASLKTSTAFAPPDLSYSKAGTYYIEINAYSSTGSLSSVGKSITVKNLIAPAIDFSTDNVCLLQQNSFTTSIVGPSMITNWSWDFGDGNTSVSPTPANQYTNTGIYSVTLDVTASNTCSNRVIKDVQIFNPPSASFVLPSGLICTNNQFTFANNTVDNFDGNLTYQWYIDNAPIATTRDLNYAFPTTGNKDVKLKTSIPGCFSEQTQTVTNVLPGPAVGFTIFGKCENENILFTNNSSGSITGYIWNFGNSQTSTLLNPTQNYSKGNYTVSLEATAPNGCISSIAKNLNIYSKPQPDFSIGLPPFSCAGSASQFTDLTPALTDSNIATWTWGFGDAAEGSSSVKNPSYTYATASTYNVSLAVATNFGCTNSVQKAVTISPSPVAGFSNRPACVNQATQFTDASSGSIKSRLWQIQSSTFTTPNPQFIFPFAGSFPVVLTVTGNNNCVSQASKNIVVPVVPSLDFSVQAPCANSPTFFTELTTSVDPSISKSWSFGSQGTGSGSPVQYTFSSTSTYAVQLNSTRQSGCVYSVSKNVSIVSPPVADFLPSIDAGAAPLPVSFTNNSSGANSYLWKFGDQGNSTSVLVSPTFVFSELGAYNVELSASNSVGCTNRLSKPINVVVPNVDAEMTDFFFVKDTNTGSLQPVVKLLNRSNITLTNPIILLDVAGGSGVSQQITGTVKPNQEMSQMLDLKLVPKTNQYVCAEVVVAGDVDTFLNRKCLSLSGEEVLFPPFPNPAREQLNLDWISIDGSAVTFQVLTSAGAVSLQQTISSINLGLNRLIINTSALSTGIYFIRFRDGKTDRTFSFAVAGN